MTCAEITYDEAKRLFSVYYEIVRGGAARYEETTRVWHKESRKYGRIPDDVLARVKQVLKEEQRKPHLARRGNFRNSRQTVKASVRFHIMERDGFRCVYCGTTAKDDMLVVDHMIPVDIGGTSEESNLVTACYQCNVGKKSSVLRCIPPMVRGAK